MPNGTTKTQGIGGPKKSLSSMDIKAEKLSLFEPTMGHFFMERNLSKQRCLAAGHFLISTVSFFSAIIYSIIFILVSDFSVIGTVVIPVSWGIASMGNIWIAYEKFYRLDERICRDYYEKALEDAKKMLKVVEENYDDYDKCNFLMKQVGSIDASSKVCGE